jgi:hypothetical protein
MFKYIQYGYKFKILRGYLFDRKNIFKDYINDLYKIKQNHKKDDPMYLVSKLLMNSLYGRFGMSNNMANYEIILNSNLSSFIDNINQNKSIIKEIIDLNNGKCLLALIDNKNDVDNLIDLDISIGISYAITAYARIFLSNYISDSNLNIIYTDTDSIYTIYKLQNEEINNKLGG